MFEELWSGGAGVRSVVPVWGSGPLGVDRSVPVDVDDLGAGVGGDSPVVHGVSAPVRGWVL